jgi:protein phosphatase 1 regulatory subunit 10
VQQLVSKIIEYGITEVSSQTRLDIVTKIRDNAGNNYFRAWLENVSAMDITREWLKAGATTNGDNQVLETVMPLLHVCFLCPYSPALSLIKFFFLVLYFYYAMPSNEP